MTDQRVIDMNEVVYDTNPQTILEIRSAMNSVMNAQNNLLPWFTQRINLNSLSEEEKQQYNVLASNVCDSLIQLTSILEKEDRTVGRKTTVTCGCDCCSPPKAEQSKHHVISADGSTETVCCGECVDEHC